MDQTHREEIKSFNIKKLSHPYHHTYTSLGSRFFYSLVAIACTLLCTSPLWIRSFETFLFISLPNFFSVFLAPKSLFLLGNLIVIFLVRGSKIHYNSSSSLSKSLCPPSPQPSLLPLPTTLGSPYTTENEEKEWRMVCEDGDDDHECIRWEATEEEETVMDLVGKGLRERADDFIAKVNRQILTEYHVNDLF